MCARALYDLDRLSGGKPFSELTPGDLSEALAQYRTEVSERSAKNLVVRLRTFFTWLNDGTLPRHLRLALQRPKVQDVKSFIPITVEERDAMLRACTDPARLEHAAVIARKRALVWVLWDSGMRASEVLGLKIKSVQPAAGGVRLIMPEDAPDLKTGPRTVFVVDAAGPIQTWLALHPNRNNPEAYLFETLYHRKMALSPTALDKQLRLLTKRAGIRHINPHLFRHSRATRAAEAGWNESVMRAYFGWQKGSRMASHYVHLAQSQIEERVRKDAQLDPLGARIQADPQRAIADVASAAAATSSAAVIRALMDAGVLPPPKKRDDEDGGAAAPLARV
jgi:integrase